MFHVLRSNYAVFASRFPLRASKVSSPGVEQGSKEGNQTLRFGAACGRLRLLDVSLVWSPFWCGGSIGAKLCLLGRRFAGGPVSCSQLLSRFGEVAELFNHLAVVLSHARLLSLQLLSRFGEVSTPMFFGTVQSFGCGPVSCSFAFICSF